jgi:hypothetical protein
MKSLPKSRSTRSRWRSRAGGTPEKVKIDGAAKLKKQALRAPPKLVRTTFTTSREMDFFTEKELVTQTGHDVCEWPLVFGKEVIDNALDAAEEADIAPVIEVIANATGLTIKDNGPGLPEATLKATGFHGPSVEPGCVRRAGPGQAGQRPEDRVGHAGRRGSRSRPADCHGSWQAARPDVRGRRDFAACCDSRRRDRAIDDWHGARHRLDAAVWPARRGDLALR